MTDKASDAAQDIVAAEADNEVKLDDYNYNTTKLALSLNHLDRVETAILANHQRPAVESLFRRTHEGAAMRNAEAGIHSARS
jgi:hypothetical protein